MVNKLALIQHDPAGLSATYRTKQACCTAHLTVKKGCSHVLRSRVSDCWLLVRLKGPIGRKNVKVGDKVSRQHCYQLTLNLGNWTANMIFEFL